MKKAVVGIILASLMPLALVIGPISMVSAVSLPDFGGHYYQVCKDTHITWEDANTAASAMTIVFDATTYRGHLATIASAAEKNFVKDLLNDAGAENAWIGAKQLDNQMGTEDGWQWVTGESFTYKNWAAGEPNDAINTVGQEDNEENYLTIYDDGYWNDSRNDPGLDCYVVEYERRSPPLGVPGVSMWGSVALGVMLCAGMVWAMRRRLAKGETH